MSRPTLVVRDAQPADAERLVELWSEAARQADPARPHSACDAEAAIAQIAASSEERLLVGEHEDQVVAAVHLARVPLTPIHTEHAVQSSFLVVDPAHRKHGYGRALLEAAVAWAEEKDIRHVTATTGSASRDTNRFFARLGLGTVATVRLSTTAVLRKRLSPDRGIRATASSRHLGEVIAARRSLRRRRAAAS